MRALVLLLVIAGSAGATHADGAADAAKPAATKKHKKKAAPFPKVKLSCKTDADCAPTKMADGDCCPSLCQPRIVSKTSAEALAKYAATCAKPGGGQCPVAECAPPMTSVVGACVSRKCVEHAAPSPGRE
jgi:hypothetical protein